MYHNLISAVAIVVVSCQLLGCANKPERGTSAKTAAEQQDSRSRADADQLLEQADEAFGNGDRETALQLYTDVVTSYPRMEAGYYGRISVWYVEGKWANIIKDCDALLEHCELIGQKGLCYTERAYALYKMGEFQRSLEDIDRAVRHNSSLERARLLAAWILATCPDEEIRTTGDALPIGVDDPSKVKDSRVFEVSAAALAAAGEYAEAIRHQEQAVELSEEERSKVNLEILEIYKRHEAFIDKERVF